MYMDSKSKKEMKMYNDVTSMLKMNIDAENRLKQFIEITADISSLNKYELLLHCTSEMFKKLTSHLMSAFYRYRVQTDLKDKIVLPNKGTVNKITSGEKDREKKART